FTSSDWAGLTASQRGALLRRLGDLVAENAAQLSAIEVRDLGKRVSESGPQLQYLPQSFYYYAGLADKIEGTVVPLDRHDVFNFTRHEPHGVVAAILPWNSPLMLTAWKLAPALAAGNTVVLKPSEHGSPSVLELIHLVERAGFPNGVVNVVTGLGPEVGEPLVTHPKVTKISFTGSATGGRRIAELAAREFKRVTLELGGKSPQIVFPDANLDDAAHGVMSGIFASNGQSCVAGSRLLLQESIHDKFVDKLIGLMRGVRMGDPADPKTQVGPISNQPQYEKILSYIDVAKKEGAKCVMGGGPARHNTGGWFVEPTIFTEVNNNMRIAREEVFGPVLAVMPFRHDDEAVRIANDSLYGLAAGAWTGDHRRAFAMAQKLAAGTVYVNHYRSISTLSPVGGYKHSGYGRENGIEGLKDYLQVKSVWMGIGPVANPFPPATTN
ncbi:MAG: aldehyde dehydrogenase, partial [Alphaproteobacteria bacterium]|nr:aldehyde dehydrogenase [Alphaproteobacteria bacterium]